MATIVPSSVILQTPDALTHTNCSSTPISRRLNLVFVNLKNGPWNKFQGLHSTSFRRLALLNDLNPSRSFRAIQAQQSSSIADSGDRAAAPGNTEGDLRDQEATSNNEEEDDFELEKGYNMIRVCDKLIDVFMVERPKPSDWRRLLAFSEEWSKIRPHFFKRCRVRADAENDPEKKQKLLRLGRKLKEVDDDMQRHDELLKEISENPLEIDAIVARRRKDFTGDFFEHLKTVADSKHDSLEDRDQLATLGAKCLSAVQAYDNAATDNDALSVAQLKFDEILNSPSLDAACKKIDNLAKKNELDSTLMLLITKAWASAKESTMMKEEVKDIMHHLYMVARGNLQRLVPKEIRIIKHLLSMEDPQERFAALAEAFSPGDEIEGKNVDTLYTTPEKLHKWIKTVLDAYYMNREGTLIREAKQLMNPMVIQRLEILKGVVEDEYL
eukprot:Gb_11825 [translate_table: standard]